jgi:hypothetical protein
LREDDTYHICYKREAELIAQVKQFEARINAELREIADRLLVTTHLNPEIEKLRVST